jgi:hypothetical protein
MTHKTQTAHWSNSSKIEKPDRLKVMKRRKEGRKEGKKENRDGGLN